MKDSSIYRPARRNAFFVALKTAALTGQRIVWDAWRHANVTAKLGERRQQCALARKAVSDALAQAGALFRGVPTDKIITGALRVFWNEQRRTRVVHRILNVELANA